MNRRLSRRTFTSGAIALTIASTIGGVPSVAGAQRAASPRHIGVIEGGGWPEGLAKAFRQGLLEMGFVEGRDVILERRSAKGDYTKTPELLSLAARASHSRDSKRSESPVYPHSRAPAYPAQDSAGSTF